MTRILEGYTPEVHGFQTIMYKSHSGDDFSKVSPRVSTRLDAQDAGIYLHPWGSDLSSRGDRERDVYHC